MARSNANAGPMAPGAGYDFGGGDPMADSLQNNEALVAPHGLMPHPKGVPQKWNLGGFPTGLDPYWNMGGSLGALGGGFGGFNLGMLSNIGM